jgi:hypothetical protein
MQTKPMLDRYTAIAWDDLGFMFDILIDKSGGSFERLSLLVKEEMGADWNDNIDVHLLAEMYQFQSGEDVPVQTYPERFWEIVENYIRVNVSEAADYALEVLCKDTTWDETEKILDEIHNHSSRTIALDINVKEHIE